MVENPVEGAIEVSRAESSSGFGGMKITYKLTSQTVKIKGNITYFDCASCGITSIDVTNCLYLDYLMCANNLLTSLDLTKNPYLKEMSCMGNNLNTLDVSKNTALTDLRVDENQLTTLDVSKNTALEELNCGVNQLTTLDVSNNICLKTLECSPMNDAEGNNLLTTIYTAEGHEFETIEKPEETVIEEK